MITRDFTAGPPCPRCLDAGRVPLFAGCGSTPCPRCSPRPSLRDLCGREAAPGIEVYVVDERGARIEPIGAELLAMASAAGLGLDELLDRARRALGGVL